MSLLKLSSSIVVLFVFLYLLLIGSVLASSEMWSQTYGGSWGEEASSMVVTSDGGYALAGGTSSFDVANGDVWLVKTDSDGNIEWNQTYGGYVREYVFSLVISSDEGYALAGYNYPTGNENFFLVKTDVNGNMQWSQSYGGEGRESAYSLVAASDGGYALAGWTDSFGAGEADVWLVKTDVYGNMEWNKTYGGADSDGAYSLIETSDGGYAIAGHTWSFSSYGNDDFWLVKTDSDGNMQWSKTFGGARDDSAWSLVETLDGGYALAGQSNSFGDKDSNVLLVRTNSNGNLEWIFTFGGADFESAYSLVQVSDGGFALAGDTYIDAFGDRFEEGLLVKTDLIGNLEWSQTYGNNWGNGFRSLVESSDGGFVLAGNSGSFNKESEFWLIKVNESGYIPEFPSGTILPILISLSLIIIIVKTKPRKKE